jgi:hypothetical protein
MMIRDNEGMPPLEDSDGDELALPVEESLVIIYIVIYLPDTDTIQQRKNN